MEKPIYGGQQVATCLAHINFGAWVPLLPTCGAAMIAV